MADLKSVSASVFEKCITVMDENPIRGASSPQKSCWSEGTGEQILVSPDVRSVELLALQRRQAEQLLDK